MSNPIKVRNGGVHLSVRDVTDWSSLRTSAQSDPKGFAHKCDELVSRKVLSFRTMAQRGQSVKEMQAALADVVVDGWDAQSKRTIQTSAFPALTGIMAVEGITEAYEEVPTIGQFIVTESDDNKKSTVRLGVLSQEAPTGRTGVQEGQPFPLLNASEEKFWLGHRRDGCRVVITQELFEENDLGEIVSRLDRCGQYAAKSIEKQTLRRVMDVDGSGATPAEPYVLHGPNGGGAGVQLYTTTANSPGTRAPSGTRINNNALVDTSDLENARVRLTIMNEPNGDPIPVNASDQVLLVPDALLMTAWKILNSDMEPGVFNEANFYGGRGMFRPRLLSSVFLDDRSTTAWYLGAFMRQFVRKWKLRPEAIVLPGTADGAAQSFLDARIGYQARIAWDMEVGAIDYVYVVQSLAATTAPS